MEYPQHYQAESHIRHFGEPDEEERWLICLPSQHVVRGDRFAYTPWGRWYKVYWPWFFALRNRGIEVYVDGSNTRGYRLVT